MWYERNCNGDNSITYINKTKTSKVVDKKYCAKGIINCSLRFKISYDGRIQVSVIQSESVEEVFNLLCEGLVSE